MTEGDQIGGFTLLRRLGAGLGGETWLGEGKTGRYALKLVSIDEVAPMDDLLREVPGEAHAVLLTEYVEHGDLYDHSKRCGPVEPPHAAALCLQLVDALSVVHSKNILHRDHPGHRVAGLRRARAVHPAAADPGGGRLRPGQGVVVPLYRSGPGAGSQACGSRGQRRGHRRMTQMEPSARPSVQEARRMLSALADGAPLPDGGRTMMLQDLDFEESVVTRPSPTSTGEVRARRRRRFPIAGLLLLITAAAVFRATWGPLGAVEEGKTLDLCWDFDAQSGC